MEAEVCAGAEVSLVGQSQQLLSCCASMQADGPQHTQQLAGATTQVQVGVHSRGCNGAACHAGPLRHQNMSKGAGLHTVAICTASIVRSQGNCKLPSSNSTAPRSQPSQPF